MKLIAEHELDNITLLTEGLDESGKKSLFIEGIFAQAEKRNRNKRIYPKKVLESAVDRYIKDFVSMNRALGELNHPNYPMPNPENACILIKELKWNGNDVYGKAKVLSSEKGKTLAALINDGVKFGVATRGVGSITEKDNTGVVESDYTINAIDAVLMPSGIDCFVDGILENIEFYYNESGKLCESTVEEYMKHKKIGDMKKIREDFSDFIKKIII